MNESENNSAIIIEIQEEKNIKISLPDIISNFQKYTEEEC